MQAVHTAPAGTHFPVQVLRGGAPMTFDIVSAAAGTP
jgi:hypothetical protein